MARPDTSIAALLVEDDRRLAARVAAFLESNGVAVTCAERGDLALAHLRDGRFDVVILDWMLPDVEGVELCPAIRELGPSPILMLTARHGDQNEVAALQAGADDYLGKPVRPPVLLARIHALLRRAHGPAPAAVLEVGPLAIEPSSREVRYRSTRVDLTDAEYALLAMLARSAGAVVSRDALHLVLRGVPYDGLDRTIDIRVLRIRRKLGAVAAEASQLIRTVRGQGYMLVRRGGDG